MPIRAVVVDIDGTLTDYERLIDFAGVRALRKVEAQGIPVAVATGNTIPVTKAFVNFVGLSGPLICENGGVVASNDMRHRKALFSRRRADRAVAYLRRRGFPVRKIWSDPWRVSEVALELDVDENRVREALAGRGFDILSTRFALHIAEPGLDKLQGLKVALHWLAGRIRVHDVLAIGDSNNDATMLRGCGYSGCVANGSQRARAAARFLARRTHGAGVAEILRHYGLVKSGRTT